MAWPRRKRCATTETAGASGALGNPAGTAATYAMAESAHSVFPHRPDGLGRYRHWRTPSGPWLAKPIGQDPAHRYISNDESAVTGEQPTQRIGDISNPNLKQWAKDVMKKDDDECSPGVRLHRAFRIKAAGVPGFDVLPGCLVHPAIADGSRDDLLWKRRSAAHLVERAAFTVRNPVVRRICHHEGDTLVVDTIGLDDKTFLDNYRTPHTDKLHVTERWRLIEDGKLKS